MKSDIIVLDFGKKVLADGFYMKDVYYVGRGYSGHWEISEENK